MSDNLAALSTDVAQLLAAIQAMQTTLGGMSATLTDMQTNLAALEAAEVTGIEVDPGSPTSH